MKKRFFALGIALVLSLTLVSCGKCEHSDKDDDGICDINGCGADFTDGCDNHRDNNDNGKCDVKDCEADFTDGCDNHRDKNDDGRCDNPICGKDYSDGTEYRDDLPGINLPFLPVNPK